MVAATGSGKTTVVNLQTRFYDADSGEILIDGVNIRDMNLSALRKKTGIVLQDTVLFSETLRNNLKYADETADDEKMKKSSQLANCDKNDRPSFGRVRHCSVLCRRKSVAGTAQAFYYFKSVSCRP